MAGSGDVQYLVLPNSEAPYLLARVRWPDVFEAISPVRPDWQQDPGLFDLPYNSSCTPVTFSRAAAIAAEWGVHLPADDDAGMPRRALMRRMPADWSNLSRAERRAWAIEDAKQPTPAAGVAAPAAQKDAVPAGTARRRWRRRDKVSALAQQAVAVPSANRNGDRPEAAVEIMELRDPVIDPTAPHGDVSAIAGDA
jgi:hypothetical protein